MKHNLGILTLTVLVNFVTANEIDPISYFQKFGYLAKNDNYLLGDDYVRDAFMLFQETFHLPIDGQMNEKTKWLMERPRCGNPDSLGLFSASPTTKWSHNNISWYLYESLHFNIVQKAFDVWAKHANLTLIRSNNDPNISLSFSGSNHMCIRTQEECSYPLDGVKGGVLAHAFFPRLESEHTEIHLDNSEDWEEKMEVPSPRKTSLFLVLVHEIGHALGLRHDTTHPDSIMYPYYDIPESLNNMSNFDLSMDDIRGIQFLYGEREDPDTRLEPNPPIEQTPVLVPIDPGVITPAESKKLELCELSTKIRTYLIVRKNLYIFHERYVWVISLFESLRENSDLSEPREITTFLPFLPRDFSGVKAIYQQADGNIALFTDMYMYLISFPDLRLITRRKVDRFLGTQVREVSAAFRTNTGDTYVIFDQRYLSQISQCNSSVLFMGSINNEFPGLPNRISGAFRAKNGRIYFFSEEKVFEYDEFNETVETTNHKAIFDMFNIVCSKRTILNQLQLLVTQLLRQQ